MAIAGRPFLIGRSFVDAIAHSDVEKSIALLRRSLLIMHSPLDQVVGIDHASRMFAASRHPKSFISLDTADHLLTTVADANYTRTVILEGPLSDDQRAGILAIADRCPVDLTLVRGSDVQTELADVSNGASRVPAPA